MNNNCMTKRLYLAPVKGVTDRVFRKTFASFFSGIDLAVAPFVTMSDSDKKFSDLSPAANEGMKTVPQILAKSAEEFISLAVRLADNGSDEINWNLGCPFKKVIDSGKGAALLKSPDLIESLLDEIFNSPLPLISVKMRLGMDDPHEIIHLLEIMNNYPIHEIIIHARTADQMYEGDVNIPAFNEAAKISRHRIVYNGDIKKPGDIELISESTGELWGWMIGRGILVNPFLAEEIRTGMILTADEKIKRLKEFLDTLFEEYNSELHSPAHVLDKMRGIWYYLSQSFENGHKIDKKIRKTGSVRHYRDEVKRIFEGDINFKMQESLIRCLNF